MPAHRCLGEIGEFPSLSWGEKEFSSHSNSLDNPAVMHDLDHRDASR